MEKPDGVGNIWPSIGTRRTICQARSESAVCSELGALSLTLYPRRTSGPPGLGIKLCVPASSYVSGHQPSDTHISPLTHTSSCSCQTSLFTMIQSTSPASVLVLVQLVVLFAPYFWYTTRWRTRTCGRPLPPGPKRLPIVGNMFNMPRLTQWVGFRDLSRQLGKQCRAPSKA